VDLEAGAREAARRLEEAAKEAARRLEEAEARGRALEEERRVRQEAERRVHELEERLAEAQRQAGSQAQLLEASEERARGLERRAQDAEQIGAQLAARLQELEQLWQAHADARVKEVKLQFAEKDMLREGEVKGALLELEALRGEVHRGVRPPPAFPPILARGPDGAAHSQSWLAQSRDSLPRLGGTWPRPGGGLLSGRVREQAERLTAQWERLQQQHDEPRLPGGL